MKAFFVFYHHGPEVRPLRAGDVVLGEEGRGRTLVKPTLVGVEPEAEDFSALAAPGGGLVLLPPQGEKGILLLISSNGGYRRDRRGRIEVLAGAPTLLAEGRGAWGDAGGVGGWVDHLYQMDAPTLFRVHPSGKAQHDFFVLADPDGNIRIYADERTLLQTIVAGRDPLLDDLARQVDPLPEEWSQALALAALVRERLGKGPEGAEGAQDPAPDIYTLGNLDLEEALRELRLALLPGHRGGFSGEVLPGGYLAPGDKPLLLFQVPRFGGARYRVIREEVEGIRLVAKAHDPYGDTTFRKGGLYAAVVEDEAFRVVLEVTKDKAAYGTWVLDAEGSWWRGEPEADWREV